MNIVTRSILGRFLEHSRIFYVANAGEPEYWIGSSDLMHRNLDRRVEALVRVTDPDARAHLDAVLNLCMADDVAGFDLAADGTWHRREGTHDVQKALLRRVIGRAE